MTRFRLPHALIMALVAVAAAAPAAALPPFYESPGAAPVRHELVDDSELAGITGKYLGSNMLVGLRVDLVSTLSTGQGGTAMAGASLYIQRTGSGFRVLVDSRADAAAPALDPATATAGAAGTEPVRNIATGGDRIDVQGIGQITQIAGDNNRMANLALIEVVDALAAADGFNGRRGLQAASGDMVATVSFVGGGVELGLSGPGATIRQQALAGGAGGVMQVGQIAGDGMVASNSMHLQMLSSAMPILSMQQLGIQQALVAISGLRH